MLNNTCFSACPDTYKVDSTGLYCIKNETSGNGGNGSGGNGTVTPVTPGNYL